MNKADTIAIIRSLLSSTTSSYSIYNLNRDFRNETGVDIPLFGYSNISDFLNSIPDTVQVTGIYPVEQISLVINEKSSHIVSLVKRQKNSGPKKKYFLKNKSLIRKGGISPRTEEIHRTQAFLDKSYSNDFRGSNNDYKNKISFITDMLQTELELTLSLNPARTQIPSEDFCYSQKSIPPIDLELHARIGEYVEVYPCQIFNPHKFFFHFRKFKKEFKDFCEKFNLFYSTHEIPKIRAEHAKPKQICAVFHKIDAEPRWCRAEIYEFISSSRVMVNLIDYGKMTEIPMEKLKLLHGNFISFPKQAVSAFLANIKPIKKDGLKWSLRACKKFYDLAFRKALVAGVVEVDSKNCCIGMALSSTMGSEIHINDTLVKEGYADFDVHILDCLFAKENLDQNEIFSRNTLRSVKSTDLSLLQGPIFFPCNNNNKRLKKMFLFGKE